MKKRMISILLALVSLVAILPATVSPQTAYAAQSDLEATIEEQIHAFADSIDQEDADDTASLKLATHGITKNGSKMTVGKSHALTATLFNSELLQVGLTKACTEGIQAMQELCMENTVWLYGAAAWHTDRNIVYSYLQINESVGVENRDWSAARITYTGQTNGYDESLVWMAGNTDLRITIVQTKATKDSVTYKVTCKVQDRFDFDTSSGDGFSDLISGMGALLFKEFDWEASVSFNLIVPNPCAHESQMYHWSYDATNRTMTSLGDGFAENDVTGLTYLTTTGNTTYYYELDQSVHLHHDLPWVIEYDVAGPSNVAFAPIDYYLCNTQLTLMQGGTGWLFFRMREYVFPSDSSDSASSFNEDYGTTLDDHFSYSRRTKHTFRLENVPSDDGNMIYLTVTNAETGAVCMDRVPMDDFYEENIYTDGRELVSDSSNILSGKDFHFRYIGNKSFTFVADYFDLRIWENGDDGTVQSHFQKSSVTQPTCTARGYTTYTCASCGYSKKADYVAKTAHEYGSVGTVTQPTCTEQGYTTYTCSCGDAYADSYVDALSHDMSEWETTKEATCTEDGEKTRTCERDGCNHTETEAIEAEGHTYESVVTPATCTEQGYTTHTCACGDSYVDYDADVLDHDMGQWVVTEEANCLAQGMHRRTCSNCEYYEEEIIGITDHSYAGGVCAVCALPEGLEYTISGGEVTVTAYTGNAEALLVPETIEGKPVTAVADYAFQNSEIQTIVLPEGLVSMGDMVFRDCTELTSVVLPDSLTSVGRFLFTNCSALEEIQIPAGLTEIADGMFDLCSSLQMITIPETIDTIGQYAFYYCVGLRHIIFEGDLESIHMTAFDGVTATAYYPSECAGWTADSLKNYSGAISWVSYSNGELPVIVCGVTVTENADGSFTAVADVTGGSGFYAYNYWLFDATGTIVDRHENTFDTSWTFEKPADGIYLMRVYATDFNTESYNDSSWFAVTSPYENVAVSNVTVVENEDGTYTATADVTGSSGFFAFNYWLFDANGQIVDRHENTFDTSWTFEKPVDGIYLMRIYATDFTTDAYNDSSWFAVTSPYENVAVSNVTVTENEDGTYTATADVTGSSGFYAYNYWLFDSTGTIVDRHENTFDTSWTFEKPENGIYLMRIYATDFTTDSHGDGPWFAVAD